MKKKSEDRTVEELNNKIGKVLNKLRPRVINYSLIKMLKTENKIIHSPSVLPSEWWYYGLEHGQHIGFYRLRTLNYLANKFDLYLISDGISRHFFSKKKYSYTAWRTLVYLSSKFPKLLSLGMKSKTWSDHLLISSNKKKFIKK